MFFLNILFAVLPEIVSWQNDGKMIFQVKEQNNQLQECIKSSEYKFRIKYRVCYRRKNWLDHCYREMQQNNWITFNPVSGIYQVKKDVLKDNAKETLKSFDDLDDAIDEVSKTNPIILSDLKTKYVKWNRSQKKYISVRFNSECKESRRFDYMLLRVLSFGLISNKETESDWVDFVVK